MAMDVICECGREFGVTNDSVGRNVKCPECGSWVRVLAAVISDELARTTKDLTNAPENQASEHRSLAPGLSLAVTEHGWRLVASTRSVTEALPFLMLGTLNGFIGLGLLWAVLRQQTPSSSLWLLPLPLAGLLVLACLGAMRLGGRIEITIQGGQETVFTGVGGLGRTQHFDWRDVVEIQDQHITGRGGEEYHEIVLHTDKKIRTGQYLTEEQSRVILQALRQLQRTQPSGNAP